MRTQDIMISYTPDHIKTHDIYVPPKKPVEDMTMNELARGMCWKSQRNTEICRKCKAPCTFGREIIRRLESE